MKEGSRCDLCGCREARVHCESDEAKLCFDCDRKVHSANFLVSRHSRTLLCRRCLGPTPWTASGPWLGPTVSLCDRCCFRRHSRRSAEDKRSMEEEDEVDSRERDVTEEEEGNDDESEGEAEQVVPGTTEPPPSTPTESSSSGGEEEEVDDQFPCSSSSRTRLLPNKTTRSNPFHTAGDAEVASDSFRPSKYRKKSGSDASSDLMPFASGLPPQI